MLKKKDIKIPSYLKIVKEKNHFYLKFPYEDGKSLPILRFKSKASDIDFDSMEYDSIFIELFTLFMNHVQAKQPDAIQAASQLNNPKLAIDDQHLSTSKYDIMVGAFDISNHNLVEDSFKFNWNYHFIDENGDICFYFKNPSFFPTLVQLLAKIKRKKSSYKKLISPKKNSHSNIPPYLHFFPFRTKMKSMPDSFKNEQVLYAIAFPEFIATTFQPISSLKVFSHKNMFSMVVGETKIGYTNFAINALSGFIKQASDKPKKGFGITGQIVIDKTKSHIKLEIFDIGTSKIIYEELFKFNEKETIKIAFSIIEKIARNCNLRIAPGQIVVPDSFRQHHKGFLAYLKLFAIVNMAGFISGLLNQRKKVLGAEVFSKENIFKLFKEGFKAQSDFLVLQIMYVQFLKSFKEEDRKKYKDEIVEIDLLIDNKQEIYKEFFKSMNLKKGFFGFFKKK